MKNKIVYLFIISMVVVSCKKDEEQPPYNGPAIWVTHYDYFKGRIIDTTTGLPLSNFPVYSTFLLGSSPIASFCNTDPNGYYTLNVHFGDRYSPPKPGGAIMVSAQENNKYGFLKFSASQLVDDGTILLPDIYVKPIGYLKIHIKDTTGVNSDSLGLRTLNPYLYPFTPYPYADFIYNYFNNTSGHNVDTTFSQSAIPNLNSLVRWKYKKSSLIYKDSILFPILSNDTASVNIFY